MNDRNRAVALLLLVGLVPPGCSAPAAAVDLITIARRGIASSQKGHEQQHGEIVRRLSVQAAALDSGFDADVRLAAAGQLKTAKGEPVELSPEWIVSARKGYIAARDLLAEQIRLGELAHAKQQDNLKIADESLEMATQLIVQQWNVAERIKHHVLNIQRSLVNDR